MPTQTAPRSTDLFIIADELSVSFDIAGRIARIRVCKDIPAIVAMSVTAERSWRRRGSSTLHGLQAVAEAAVLAGEDGPTRDKEKAQAFARETDT